MSPRRFAATLTRAKLGHFTDTVFSFRATRTLFRPYQFKPVLKLLGTGTLRLLIADEVGLGKTIEAGLIWTELEARRQADRVLVVCPSALVDKWKREMEERFGFELDRARQRAACDDLLESPGADRLPRRAAYVCSIERSECWDGARARPPSSACSSTSSSSTRPTTSATPTRGATRSVSTCSRLGRRLVILSATPLNLRNRGPVQPAELLVPGRVRGPARRSRSASRPTRCSTGSRKSLLDPSVDQRAIAASWLDELSTSTFGAVLTLRPDFELLRDAPRTNRR